MTLAAIIDGMNAEADRMLAIRRERLGIHTFWIWRGQPNPYTVTGQPKAERFTDY